MAVVNIYVPQDLRERMARFKGVLTWSLIAADAFRNAIDSLERVNAVATRPKKFGQTPRPRPVPANQAEGVRRAKKKLLMPKGPPFREKKYSSPEGEL